MTGEPSTNPSGEDLAALQSKIGYHFESLALLRSALTHKSHSRQNYERLEFIGDAVLGYLIGIMLYRHDDSLAEDALSLMRAKLVRGTTLAEIAREIELAPHLRLGSGERRSGGRERDSILADALEAVIGAIHEDSGIEACGRVVERLFAARVAGLDPLDLKDAKTRLQEMVQGLGLPLPEYAVRDVSGADHQRRYTVVCAVEDLELECVATASSRRGAEQAAAAEMLEHPALQAQAGK